MVLIPSEKDTAQWTREFVEANAKGLDASIVTFIATRTAEWIAAQRTRAQ